MQRALELAARVGLTTKGIRGVHHANQLRHPMRAAKQIRPRFQ